MPVPTGAHGLGQHHAGGVHSLEDALQVYSPRDLPDEDRGKPFGTQLLVHAEEVDLHHLLGLGVNANMGRHRRDEANKFVALSYPHLEKKYLQLLFPSSEEWKVAQNEGFSVSPRNATPWSSLGAAEPNQWTQGWVLGC